MGRAPITQVTGPAVIGRSTPPTNPGPTPVPITGTTIPAGLIGANGQWRKQDLIFDTALPSTNSQHSALLQRIAEDYAAPFAAAGIRRVGFSWGVTLGTWADWTKGIGQWTSRPVDNPKPPVAPPGVGLNERHIIGPGDVSTLVDAWNLEGITVAAGLQGMIPNDFLNILFGRALGITPAARTAIVDRAEQVISAIDRDDISIHLGMGTEVTPLGGASSAQDDQLALAQALRAAMPSNVTIVLYCILGARYEGLDSLKSMLVNKPLWELAQTPGYLLDVHPYLTTNDWQLSNGNVTMSPANVDTILGFATRERGYLAISPEHWGESGAVGPSCHQEFAILGKDKNLAKTTSEIKPWEVSLGELEILRECILSGSQAVMKWDVSSNRPREWAFGMIHNGVLQPYGTLQKFFTQYYTGTRVSSIESGPLRGFVTRQELADPWKVMVINASRESQTWIADLPDGCPLEGTYEVLSSEGLSSGSWNHSETIDVPALSVLRASFPYA